MEVTSERPTVSVIVPVYNVAEFLVEAVESVMSQGFDDLELLLVVDCPTDGSDAIVDELAARYSGRIRVVRHERNLGVSAARNSGLDVAEGEFVLFLDGDDAYLPGSIAYLVDLARRYPQASIVGGGMVAGVSNPGLVGASAEGASTLLPAREALETVLYQNPRFDHSPWAKLFRREVFDGIRFKVGIKFEDMEIFPRLLLKGVDVVVSDRPVYFYRTNPSSFINSWTTARLDALQVTDDILALVRREEPTLEKAARNLRLSANFTSFFLASVHNEPAIASRTWEVIKAERGAALADPKVRLKNKAGILLSYLGRNVLRAIGSRRKKYM